MLVSISGSQGSGKSTILKQLEEQGFNVITRKTSRSILTDWGVSLQEVNNNTELTIRFQNEILERKHRDEMVAIKSTDLWFTERTFSDLFTYALVALGKDNTYDEWLNSYYNKCMMYNQQYSLVYYLRAGHFVPKHDGVRGTNHHYSRMVDLTMLDMTQQMVHNSKLTVIETPDIEQRVNIIAIQSQNVTRNLKDNSVVNLTITNDNK